MNNEKNGSQIEPVSSLPGVTPPVDVFEGKNDYLLVADLPGVAKEALAIHVEKGRLSFEGKRAPRKDGEPSPFEFRRSFVLPKGVDETKIEAELSGGVLTLRLPKAEQAKPRRIEVKAG